jgi:hypothetical protein
LTKEQLTSRVSADAAESAEDFARAVEKVKVRAEQKALAGQPLDILALSGGGDWGAFGAGFLVGWGEAPGEWRRPTFDVVTGVSTGALLAPYALFGDDESCQQIDSFYRNPKDDWVTKRGLLFFLPGRSSLMKIKGLERDVRSEVDREFVDRLARESRAGRVLAISATDADQGAQKLWDLGAEAEAATDDAGIDRVQRILLASAAVPGAFPPVEIGDGLYVDGAVTANVLLRLDPRSPQALFQRWRAEHGDRPMPEIRYWVIINNQLRPAPAVVQPKWTSVVTASLMIASRSATIAQLRWLASEADNINASFGTKITVRVAAIPDDWRPPVAGSFARETMESLADLGRALGSDPSSWMVWASPDHGAELSPVRSIVPQSMPSAGASARQ